MAELDAQATARPPSEAEYDRIGVAIREAAMRLESALASDVVVAREAIARALGRVTVEERDGGTYAQMDIGPVLLEAVRADVTTFGCGGRI